MAPNTGAGIWRSTPTTRTFLDAVAQMDVPDALRTADASYTLLDHNDFTEYVTPALKIGEDGAAPSPTEGFACGVENATDPSDACRWGQLRYPAYPSVGALCANHKMSRQWEQSCVQVAPPARMAGDHGLNRPACPSDHLHACHV